jgi:hypothetical protein
MMLHKSFVSLILAFAVATGVAASVTPVARGGGGSECNTGTQSCCNSIAYADDPIITELEGLADIAIPVDPTIPLGIDCIGILSASSW